jgi:hypothetical protein
MLVDDLDAVTDCMMVGMTARLTGLLWVVRLGKWKGLQ